MTTGKTIALTRQTFVGKVIALLFNVLSRLGIAFLPRSKHLLISGLHSPSAVVLEPPQNIVSHCFHYFPIYLPWSDGTRWHHLSFLNVKVKTIFLLSSFTFIKRLFSGKITPERLKRCSQSKNNTQLSMWQVMEVKSDAVESILHRNLECLVHESRQIGSGQTADGKSEHRRFRNQWTKMDWNGWI